MLHERRRFARRFVSPRPYVAINGSSSGGMLYDVSEGGMAIDIIGPRPATDNILLTLELAEINEHFEAKGQITWAHENENRVGLKFVDLSETSHLKIKRWLRMKTGANPLQKARAMEAAMNAPLNPPMNVPLGSRMNGPVNPPTVQATVRREEKREEKRVGNVVTRAVSRGPEARTVRAVTPDPNALIPEEKPAVKEAAKRIAAMAMEREEKLVDGLRSSFRLQEPLPVISPEEQEKAKRAPLDREILQRWITMAAVVFVLILAVALAKWIYASPALDKIATPGGIRDIVANVFSSMTDKSEASENLRNTNPADGSKVARPMRRETITPGNSGAGKENGNSVADKRVTPFEIMDAKNERVLVPRKGGVAAAPVASGSSLSVAEISGGQPASGSLMQERGGSKVGLVLLHPSTEIPENKVLPEYPAMALQRNVQGRVVLKAVIGKDGTLQNVRLVGPPSLLSGPVMQAVKEWRYQPRFQNGVAVEVETQITIDFEINAK